MAHDAEAEAIAGRLTKAQVKGLMDPETASDSVRWKLADFGLLDWGASLPTSPRRWFRLPKGTRVRDVLLARENGGE